MNDHMLCAMVLFEAQTAAKQLQIQVAALEQEIERLKSGGEKLHAVPLPEDKQDGI